MLNCEKFLKELKEIGSTNFGLKNGRPFACHSNLENNCNQCDFGNLHGCCDVHRMEWLLQESKIETTNE